MTASSIDSTRPVGRPCVSCDHPRRSALEAALLSRDIMISSISSEFGVSIAALRRHRDHHMSASEADVRDAGLEPQDIVQRLVRLSERLEDAATLAESKGRITELVRATDALRRIERDLLELTGVTTRDMQEKLDTGWAITRAVVMLSRHRPDLAEAVAAELDRTDRRAFADEFRELATEHRKALTA